MTEIRKGPSSLFNICLRFVSKNLSIYKETRCLHLMPALVKNSIITNVCRVQNGFHDDNVLIQLLNTSLVKINLGTCKITDDVLTNIANRCSNIKSLSLTNGIFEFTRNGIAGSIPKLTKLQRFYARNSNVIDDDIIALIANACPELNLLDVGSCKNITDKSADHIKNLKLVKLNVSHTKITDKFLETLAKNNNSIGLLDDLNVSYTAITVNGLRLIQWDKIKYIGFEGCNINGDFSELGIKMSKNIQYIQWTITN